MRKLKIALVGYSGAVGVEVLSILKERRFPVEELKLLASARSAGRRVRFQGEDYYAKELREDNAQAMFEGFDAAIFSAGKAVSRQYAPVAAGVGCIVVDNSTAFRMDADVPLIVPEINLGDLGGYKQRNIVANPNCTTAITLMALAPLHRRWGLKWITGATYQAVSGIGQKGLEELEKQQVAAASGRALRVEVFPYRIHNNVIPQVDDFLPDGYTVEERKMTAEGRKILNLPSFKSSMTCVRVPVPRVHAIDLTAQFEQPITAQAARAVLAEAEGVQLLDDPTGGIYPMPLTTAGRDKVHVGRIRDDTAVDNALKIWICGDQLRKGAALNAVQIVEKLRDML